MVNGYFVTGTDTGCGKTEVALGLMRLLQTAGYRVLGMKPVASGSERTTGGLRNADALKIQQQGSIEVDYTLVNPYAFELPIAPHLAAALGGVDISLPVIRGSLARLQGEADLVVVEGVGGWYVPLNEEKGVSDLARFLELPVVLVVGIRLGCINHALLTAAAVTESGCRLAGWVANCEDPGMLEVDGNIETLRRRISAPLLGVLPKMADPSAGRVAARLDLALMEVGCAPSPLAMRR